MSQNVAVLSARLSKGKAQKETSDALNDLRDLLAFHQRVSIALGTSLQHLADSLFADNMSHGHFQDGNSGDNPVVPTVRGVGHFAGLQRCLLSHPHCPKVKKVSQVLPVQSDFPVHSPAIRTGHSSPGVYQGGQRSETHGSSEGYQDPPVPRRLVSESPFPGNLPTTESWTYVGS